ncbi:MAG: glycosyltransferase [Ginsengibacter sp.]
MEKFPVTVLMPVYNAEKYLAAAMESILQQTFQDFEFLIVDDASTDASASIIFSYNDTRIKYVKNERNMGITLTLNRGIEMAIGKFIARMDADDISYPERLQKQVKYLENHPQSAMVSSAANVVTENGELIYTDTTPSEFYYFKLTFTSPFFHSSVMYRKEHVIAAGLYSVPYAEDFELFWRLARTASFYNLPEVLLDYRVSGQSLFHATKKKEYADEVNKQCLRNIRFYAGANYLVKESHLQCFQYEYDLLLKENNVGSIIQCLQTLDQITAYIIEMPNINRDVESIYDAAKEKKVDIISYFVRKLPYYKRVLLMARLNQFAEIKEMVSKTVLKRLFKKSIN